MPNLGVNCFELHQFFLGYIRTCHHVLKFTFQCVPVLCLSKTGPKMAFHPLIYNYFPITSPKKLPSSAQKLGKHHENPNLIGFPWLCSMVFHLSPRKKRPLFMRPTFEAWLRAVLLIGLAAPSQRL